MTNTNWQKRFEEEFKVFSSSDYRSLKSFFQSELQAIRDEIEKLDDFGKEVGFARKQALQIIDQRLNQND